MNFLYIHGFNSSPASFKANCFARFLTKNHALDKFFVPTLSESPARAIATVSQLVEQLSDNLYQTDSSGIGLIGSSLGGFYATWLSEKYNLNAVLVNPSVNPQELLVDYIGRNKNLYTGEEYEFTREHIIQLDEITVNKITSPHKLMVLLQTGDDVLDYHLAERKYAETHLIIEKGGDHSFQKFHQHCHEIHHFLSHT